MHRPKPTRSQSIVRAAWAAGLVAVILWASGGPGASGPKWLQIPHLDKWIHFFVFGLVATLVYRALPHWLDGRKAFWLAVLATSFFGFADEFRQSFNPLRQMEFMDWVADTAGAVVAVLSYTRWPFYRNLLELPINPLKRIRHGRRHRSPTHPGIAPDHRPAR